MYGEQNPIRNGDGKLLVDEDGNQVYEELGWRVLHDQSGTVAFDDAQQLCRQEVDEDLLALQTRAVHNQVPESLIEQNQRLQAELQQLQFVHRSDVESAEQMLAQQAAQIQTDHRAMMAELEKTKKEYQKLMHDEKAANDEKWVAWVQQLQMDQALKQKQVMDDLMCRIAEQDAR